MFQHPGQNEEKGFVKKTGEGTGDRLADKAGCGGPVALPVKIRFGTCFVMDMVACVWLVLMIAVMPLYFEDGYVHIATDKAVFCRRVNVAASAMLVPALAVYLVCSLAALLQATASEARQGKFRRLWKSLVPADIFMGLYGVALSVSYLCSDYKDTALWGAGNGWYMGFLPQLMLVGAYFFVSRFWRPRKGFFYLLFSASAVVFLLGYLNRFGFYPIAMKTRSPDYFISTIGHINWYCGYAVTALFAGAAFVWQGYGKGWRRALLYGYVLLGFGTLVTQGSASGVVTLGVMLFVMFVMSAGDGGKMRRFFTVAALFSSACLFTGLLRLVMPDRLNRDDELIDLLTTGFLPVVMAILSFALLALFHGIVKKGVYPQRLMSILGRTAAVLAVCLLALWAVMTAVNTMNPGSLGRLSGHLAFTFSDDWGSGRGGTWKAGVMCFLEQEPLHKLTGVGPDAMAAYLYQDAGRGLQRLLNTAFEGLTLTNAHNEWLTVLVNTGIFGLVCFGGAMVTAVAAFLKKPGGAAARGGGRAVCLACGFSMLAYTVNNIFSFQQTVNLTTMTLILGMGMAFMRRSPETRGEG